MNIGDKVEVINPKRGHFGLTGEVVSRTLLDFGVAIRDRAGRHLGGGMYESGELKLIEEGQNVTTTMTQAEFLALSPADQAAMIATHVMEWKPWRSPCVKGSTEPDCWQTGDPQSPTMTMTGWRPTKDISDAWQVFERNGFYGNVVYMGTDYACTLHVHFGENGAGQTVTVDEAVSAPLAICLAAMKVAGAIV